MKQSITKICEHLGINFKNDTEIENVGWLSKINKNAVLLSVREFFQDYSLDNCIVICMISDQVSESHKVIGNSLIIYTHEPLDLLYKIINELLVNSPLNINELNLKYRSNPNKQIFIKRLYGSFDPSEDNYAQRIGISGDLIFKSNGDNKVFNNIGWVELGHNVIIGNNVTIYRGALGATKIGNNVIIEDNVVIYSDIVIGDNTTIIAGSVVSKNIQPNTIYNSFNHV